MGLRGGLARALINIGSGETLAWLRLGESGRGFVEAYFLSMNPNNLHNKAGKEGIR